MRVTDALRFQHVQRALASAAREHAAASRRASSGARIERPSDDPVGAAELVRLGASRSQVAAQRDTVRTVSGDLALAEATLAESGDLLAQAKSVALQGANGSLSASERSMLAEQVRQLRGELVGLANAKGSRGFLFAGSQTATRPFSAAGAFSGDAVDFVVDVGGGPTAAGANGARAFTLAGGRDVFADLNALESALTANDPTAVAATLDALEASRAQLGEERGRVGLRMEKLQTSEQLLEQASVVLTEATERVGAADPFESFSRMTALSQALERSVAVSRQLLDLGTLWRG